MQVDARLIAGTILYGALVLVGSLVLGLVVAPLLGMASGAFAVEADARAFFSWLMLEAVPLLVGLSVFSSAFHRGLSGRPAWVWGAVLVANAVGVWTIGAAVSLLILG